MARTEPTQGTARAAAARRGATQEAAVHGGVMEVMEAATRAIDNPGAREYRAKAIGQPVRGELTEAELQALVDELYT